LNAGRLTPVVTDDVLFKRKQRPTRPETQVLDEALGSWREAQAALPAERLSAGARANIRVLSRQRSAAAEQPLTHLFVPLGRLVAAAGVPALLLAVSFGWLIGGGGGQSGRSEAPASAIETSKVNGRAVFEIANGGRVHRVYRAYSTEDLAHAELFATTRGSFADSLEGHSGVVYYRID
jgi:hypothetical protein